MYEISGESDMKERLDNLICKGEALSLCRGTNFVNQVHNGICSLCAMHTSELCPFMTGSFECYSAQANALNNYGKATVGPFLEI